MACTKSTSHDGPRISPSMLSVHRPFNVIIFLVALLALLHATASAVASEAARPGKLPATTPVSANRHLLSDAQRQSAQPVQVSVTTLVVSVSQATARMLYTMFPETRNDDRDHAHYLDPQNRARAEVGSAPLVWDADLQAQAERLADYLAREEGCALQRLHEVSAGVNLRWAAESWGVPAEAGAAVAEWVREKAHYQRDAFPAGCAEGRECGHYTQVVWKRTERVGCGTAMCNEGGAVWACRYFPPGNIEGYHPY